MRLFLIFLVTSCAIYSCSSLDDSKDKYSFYNSTNNSESDTLMFLKNGGDVLSLTLPKSILTSETTLQVRENFGDVELYIHPGFHVYISKENTALSEIKSELQSDGFFSRKFIDESEDELFYQSTLPDGTEIGFNWVKIFKTSGYRVIVRSDPQGDYSKQDVRTMQKHMNTLNIL